MATPFSKTLRALAAERRGRSGGLVAVALALGSALAAWGLLAELPVRVVSSKVEVVATAEGWTVRATFSPPSTEAGIRAGQPALLRLRDAAGRATVAKGIVQAIERGATRGELRFRWVGDAAQAGAGAVERVEVEVARRTAASLLLRAAGWRGDASSERAP